MQTPVESVVVTWLGRVHGRTTRTWRIGRRRPASPRPCTTSWTPYSNCSRAASSGDRCVLCAACADLVKSGSDYCAVQACKHVTTRVIGARQHWRITQLFHVSSAGVWGGAAGAVAGGGRRDRRVAAEQHAHSAPGAHPRSPPLPPAAPALAGGRLVPVPPRKPAPGAGPLPPCNSRTMLALTCFLTR